MLNHLMSKEAGPSSASLARSLAHSAGNSGAPRELSLARSPGVRPSGEDDRSFTPSQQRLQSDQLVPSSRGGGDCMSGQTETARPTAAHERPRTLSLALYFVSGRQTKLPHAGQELNRLGRAGVERVYLCPAGLDLVPMFLRHPVCTAPGISTPLYI